VFSVVQGSAEALGRWRGKI